MLALTLNLYKKFGFVDTGKIEYEENVLEVLTKDIIYITI